MSHTLLKCQPLLEKTRKKRKNCHRLPLLTILVQGLLTQLMHFNLDLH